MSNVVINRPWISSFSFNSAACSGQKLDQVHKLSRNFVASLDLGCPSVRHVNKDGHKLARERYKAWVADWKIIYGHVSALIRLYKQYRKTIRCPKPHSVHEQHWKALNRDSNMSAQQGLQLLSSQHLARLQETAQVLLNARYNAKLAAAEARRRSLAKQPEPA